MELIMPNGTGNGKGNIIVRCKKCGHIVHGPIKGTLDDARQIMNQVNLYPLCPNCKIIDYDVIFEWLL